MPIPKRARRKRKRAGHSIVAISLIAVTWFSFDSSLWYGKKLGKPTYAVVSAKGCWWVFIGCDLKLKSLADINDSFASPFVYELGQQQTWVLFM